MKRRVSRTPTLFDVTDHKSGTVAQEGQIPIETEKWPEELTAERKIELVKIFKDHNLDFDTVRRPAAEEAAAPYMAELEMASADFDLAAFVFRKREDDGCIRTMVFTLNKNAFRMDWTPDLNDKEKEEKFFKKKQLDRSKEVADKTFYMGMLALRHQCEPLGMFCISIDDDDDDGSNGWNVWRFAHTPYTSEDQDFLETVANAYRFSATRARSHWDDDWTEIDFWRQDDGTFAFHFTETTN